MNGSDDFGLGLFILVLWIGAIIMGVKTAKKKGRSPHWMWFSINPLGALIALAVLASLQSLKKCAGCGEWLKPHARVCAYCGHTFGEAEG